MSLVHEIDINYVKHEEQTKLFLITELKWLNKLILYLPMWSTLTCSHQNRPTILNIFMLLLILLAVIADYAYHCYKMIETSSQYTSLSNTFWAILLLLRLVSRFISAYYFYFLFKWPWHYKSFELKDYDGYNKNIVKRYNRVIQIVLVTVIIIDFVIIFSRYYDYELNDSIAYIDLIIYRIFILYPQCMLIVVQAAIFIKFYLYLSEISNNIRDNENASIEKILDQYEKLYKCFNIDYSKVFQTSVQLFLFSQLMYSWDSSNKLDTVDQIWKQILIESKVAIICILFVVSASLITECYWQFVNILWSKGKDYVTDKHKMTDNKACYVYTVQYVQQHPITISIGTYAVTKINALRFVILLVIVKTITWAMYQTLQRH